MGKFYEYDAPDIASLTGEEIFTIYQQFVTKSVTITQVLDELVVPLISASQVNLLSDVGDVVITGDPTGQVLKYDGANWVNAADESLAPASIDDIGDVFVTGIGAGQDGWVLTWNNGTGNWIPAAISTSLSALDDVFITGEGAPSDAQVLTYESGLGWVASTPVTVNSFVVAQDSVLESAELTAYSAGVTVMDTVTGFNSDATGGSIVTVKLDDSNGYQQYVPDTETGVIYQRTFLPAVAGLTGFDDFSDSGKSANEWGGTGLPPVGGIVELDGNNVYSKFYYDPTSDFQFTVNAVDCGQSFANNGFSVVQIRLLDGENGNLIGTHQVGWMSDNGGGGQMWLWSNSENEQVATSANLGVDHNVDFVCSWSSAANTLTVDASPSTGGTYQVVTTATVPSGNVWVEIKGEDSPLFSYADLTNYTTNSGTVYPVGQAAQWGAWTDIGNPFDQTLNTTDTVEFAGLGIGESAPQTTVHIKDGDTGGTAYAGTTLTIEKTSNPGISLLGNTSGDIFFVDSVGLAGWVQYVHGTDTLRFATAVNNRMVIDSTGQVGINNDIPAYRLDVDGDINITGGFYVSGSPFTSGISWSTAVDSTIAPADPAGDGLYDIGTATAQFNNIYYSGALTYNGTALTPIVASDTPPADPTIYWIDTSV